MKIIINIPNDYGATEVRDTFDETEFTLATNPSLEEIVQLFKLILYLLTYHPDTIARAFGDEEYE